MNLVGEKVAVSVVSMAVERVGGTVVLTAERLVCVLVEKTGDGLAVQ